MKVPILDQGEHAGFRWIMMSNDYACRCGYVLIPLGHPWHGRTALEIDEALDDPGVTYSDEIDGVDGVEGWWVGFDCGHASDAPDPDLPARPWFGESARAIWTEGAKLLGGGVKDAAYVRSKCEQLCAKAAVAGG